MISGWRWRPDRAWSTIAEIGGYIGQVRSLIALVARPVVADRALVVERPARVVAPQPGRGGLVVGAVARLVAERPEDDRRVVLVALGHPRDAVDPRAEVAGVVAQRALEGVRLDVGLVDDVQPELVGQLEEGRVVRVVRGPDRVEPELLHQHEVGAHLVPGDGPPGVLVEVVAVDAADEDARAVDEQVEPDGSRPGGSRSGGVASSATAPSGRAQDDRAAGRGVGCSADQRSTPGSSTCQVTRPSSGGAIRRWTAAQRRPPRPAIGSPAACRNMSRWSSSVQPSSVARVDGPRVACERLGRARRGAPRPSSRARARGPGSRRHGQVERPGRQVVGEPGVGPDVGEVDRAGRVQEDRPGDPAVPPLVLVLDVGRVGPLDDRQPERVRAGAGGRRSGRTRRPGASPCSIPIWRAVELDDEHALGGPDVEDDPPARPTPAGSSNVALVDAGRVLLRDVRRRVRRTASGRSCSGAGPRCPASSRAPGTSALAPVRAGRGIRAPEELEAPRPVEREPVGVGDAVHREPAELDELGRDPRLGCIGPSLIDAPGPLASTGCRTADRGPTSRRRPRRPVRRTARCSRSRRSAGSCSRPRPSPGSPSRWSASPSSCSPSRSTTRPSWPGSSRSRRSSPALVVEPDRGRAARPARSDPAHPARLRRRARRAGAHRGPRAGRRTCRRRCSLLIATITSFTAILSAHRAAQPVPDPGPAPPLGAGQRGRLERLRHRDDRRPAARRRARGRPVGGAVALIGVGLAFGLAALPIIGVPDPHLGRRSRPAGSLVDAWQGVVYWWRNRTLRGLGFSDHRPQHRVRDEHDPASPLIVLRTCSAQASWRSGSCSPLSGVSGMVSAFLFGRLDSRGREWRMLIVPMLLIAPAYALILPVAGGTVVVAGRVRPARRLVAHPRVPQRADGHRPVHGPPATDRPGLDGPGVRRVDGRQLHGLSDRRGDRRDAGRRVSLPRARRDPRRGAASSSACRCSGRSWSRGAIRQSTPSAG